MGIQREKIQAILLDIDGTIADTDDMMTQKLAGKLRPFRFVLRDRNPQPLARWLVMFSETPANIAYHIADTLGLDELMAPVLERIHKWRGESREEFQLVPGTIKMLQNLQTYFPLAVVSARDQRTSMLFIEQFNLGDYFQILVTAQSTRRTKPHPMPILKAAAALQIVPENCLMVGDTTVDIRSAKKAGAQAIGVLCGFGTRTELERAGADAILDSTAELDSFLGVA